jgi:anthranilate/para-aminobenzoate synthase component II
MKDVKNEEWPIMGICQGLEVISVFLNDDKVDTLDIIDIYGQSLPIDWNVHDITLESRLFQTFPDYLVEAMDNDGLALHAHTYSISLETFNKTKGLNEFMKVTQTDVWKRPSDGKMIKFIASMEAKEYPIFTTMYHPEYQLLDYLGDKRWEGGHKDHTEEIAFRISLVMNRFARMNSNRVAPQNEVFFNKIMSINRIPAQPFPMVGL